MYKRNNRKNRKSLRRIMLEVKLAYQDLWTFACVHDHIDMRSSFILFSDNNPHVKGYNRLYRKWGKLLSKLRISDDYIKHSIRLD